jgi:hypothetical protein
LIKAKATNQKGVAHSFVRKAPQLGTTRENDEFAADRSRLSRRLAAQSARVTNKKRLARSKRQSPAWADTSKSGNAMFLRTKTFVRRKYTVKLLSTDDNVHGHVYTDCTQALCLEYTVCPETSRNQCVHPDPVYILLVHFLCTEQGVH